MKTAAWLVSGGHIFVDKAFVSEVTANRSVDERGDGASKKALVLAADADAQIAALQAECEALRAALKRITDVADRVDGWQSFPQDVLDAAYAAIYNERSKA